MLSPIFLLANITTRHSYLPEISEGENCVPGYLYRMSCNTCHCLAKDALVCTKMACLSQEMMEELLNQKRKANVNIGRSNNRKTKKRIFPILPQGKCEPGKLYSKGCQICFCNHEKRAECSQKSCKLKMTSFNVRDPGSFESAFPVKDTKKLPSLPHMGSTCELGKTYKVDCNVCFCRDNGDLMCSSSLCPTSEGFKAVAAREKTGAHCTEGFIDKPKCIKCICENGLTVCSAIKKCEQANIHPVSLLTSKTVQVLDYKQDKCTPNMIYSVHCNTCYCQVDGSLRCTQKLCLTNSEANKLEEQRIYLEKYGL